MLAAGGRVVRVDHDPSVDNRLMVPSEHELKTILYDQVINGDLSAECNGITVFSNKIPRRVRHFTLPYEEGI